MRNDATRRVSRSDPGCVCSVSAAVMLVLVGLAPTEGRAYTAAGDRNFPATLNLPQPAPTDAFWSTFNTQPMAAEKAGEPTRQTSFEGTYSKLITERLGLQLEDGIIRVDRLGASSVNGAENLHLTLQYEPVLDQRHEFVLSVQVDQEFGGTGSQRVRTNASQSATTPGVTFAKGLGDLPIGSWQPLAITGFAGYRVGYGERASAFEGGLSLQYSIPYLVSKVTNADLPSFFRGMTPLVELLYTTPVRGQSGRKGNSTMFLVAPGVSYSRGEGWEFGIEALIPATGATGSGLGVVAQLVLQFDYLLPDSVFGRPIFRPAELP